MDRRVGEKIVDRRVGRDKDCEKRIVKERGRD